MVYNIILKDKFDNQVKPITDADKNLLNAYSIDQSNSNQQKVKMKVALAADKNSFVVT